jgi:hypothetical protein
MRADIVENLGSKIDQIDMKFSNEINKIANVLETELGVAIEDEED